MIAGAEAGAGAGPTRWWNRRARGGLAAGQRCRGGGGSIVASSLSGGHQRCCPLPADTDGGRRQRAGDGTGMHGAEKAWQLAGLGLGSWQQGQQTLEHGGDLCAAGLVKGRVLQSHNEEFTAGQHMAVVARGLPAGDGGLHQAGANQLHMLLQGLGVFWPQQGQQLQELARGVTKVVCQLGAHVLEVFHIVGGLDQCREPWRMRLQRRSQILLTRKKEEEYGGSGVGRGEKEGKEYEAR